VFIVASSSDFQAERCEYSPAYAAPQDSVALPVDLLPTPGAADSERGPSAYIGGERQSGAKRAIDLSTVAARELLPTPRASDPANASSHSSEGFRPQLGEVSRTLGTDWGKYEPAIRRWENLTRPAPPPTEPNKNGNPRLAAAFSEWLMGWPQGWVTDPAIGISRNDQLKIVGNGVCPQQAAAALRYLLAVATDNTHTHTPEVSDVTTLMPTPRATDGTKGGPNQRGSSGDLMLPSAVCQMDGAL
jgi:hypothetical protein